MAGAKGVRIMKIKDVTPLSFSCCEGACPAVFKTYERTYLIIGNKVESPENLLPGKIGPDETVIEVPVNLILGVTPAEDQS